MGKVNFANRGKKEANFFFEKIEDKKGTAFFKGHEREYKVSLDRENRQIVLVIIRYLKNEFEIWREGKKISYGEIWSNGEDPKLTEKYLLKKSEFEAFAKNL